MNITSSPYQAICTLFCRGSHGELLAADGRNAEYITQNWAYLQTLMTSSPSKKSRASSGIETISIDISSSSSDGIRICDNREPHDHSIQEILRSGRDSHYVGLISCRLLEESNQVSTFRDWLENFILSKTTLVPLTDSISLLDPRIIETTELITILFSETLRNIPSNDEWDLGKVLFARRVSDFVARGDRIQMSLPAFPCKSPNPQKVGGSDPDLAERIALQTLKRFASAVRKIYPPGVTIWVTSDGQVFSDCIGVDDENVNRYDQKLKETYENMATSPEDRQAVQFRSLTDILFSNDDVDTMIQDHWTSAFSLNHPIASKRSPEVELARKIMMAGFQNPREEFERLIATQDGPTLSLYRGQARFMQEDIGHPAFLAKSSKQRKKHSFVVAAEMIARNQAYSNLVELLFPNYVRLSIHAHSNRGPKFGICLLPRHQVQAIDSIKSRHELQPAYEFQVPTPWHNSMIKIEGDPTLYLGKASMVREALEQGDFEGEWVDDPHEGGHFSLKPKSSISNASCMTAPSPSILSIEYNDEKEMALMKSEAVQVLLIEASDAQSSTRMLARLRGKLCRFFRLPKHFNGEHSPGSSVLPSSKRRAIVRTC